MTDDHVPEDARPGAEALIRELRAFTQSEAEELDALAAELTAIQGALRPPVFDREAIWARVGGRLGLPSEPGSSQPTDE